MQVDIMCRAEAAITIKQNKKNWRRGHLYNERVFVHCLIMAQRQRLVNIFSKAAQGKEGKKKRNCGHADGERRKNMNI